MNDLDQIRANALAKIDRAAMWFRLALWGALLFEGLFTIGIIYFADFSDQLHLLILCCTGVIYMPVILGLMALGAHINRCTLRILARLDS